MSLTSELEDFHRKCLVAMSQKVDKNAIMLQNYMKTHYKWTPRSHRANRTMLATWEKDENEFTIALAYGVEYGVYLELAHEKRYALTHPTAKLKAPEVIKSFEDLVEKL